VNPLIAELGLAPNVEGGFYRQTWESPDSIEMPYGSRPLANTIYYLLTEDSPIGHFHSNRSDITHFFHSGGPITYILISPRGSVRRIVLGLDHDLGERLSFTCPGGWWKSSHIGDGCSHGLVSEITVPGFRTDDHRMLTYAELARRYPDLVGSCREYVSK